MKAAGRRLVLTLLYWTGMLWVWRLWRRDAVVILTVHGVLDETREYAWRPLRRRLSLQQLDKTLQVLKKHYQVVSLADAVEMLSGQRPLQRRSVALTFDDGYRSQVIDTEPLLSAQCVPATVFVSTGHVTTRQPFWFDRLDYALQHTTLNTRELTVGDRHLEFSATTTNLTECFSAVRRAAKEMLRDDREMCREIAALATDFEAAGGRRLIDILETDPLSAPLTPNEIRQSGAAFTFGSHTVDHLRINRVPADVVADQLTRSKAALESWTGKPCRLFCYPDGGFNREAAALVKACGYDAAVTTERGTNRVGDDLMMLRRIDIPINGTAAEIVAQVSGFSDWLSTWRPRLPTSAHRRSRAGAHPCSA